MVSDKLTASAFPDARKLFNVATFMETIADALTTKLNPHGGTGGISESSGSVPSSPAFPRRSAGSTRTASPLIVPPPHASVPSAPANSRSLFQSHLVAAFLARIDQPDRQLLVSRGIDRVVPQNNPVDTGVRTQIRGGVRP